MRSKSTIVLALMVAAPLAALGLLGAKVVAGERVEVERRVRQLQDDRLKDLEGAIGRSLAEVERELERALSSPPDGPALRELATTEPLIDQPFLLDPEGRLIHPLEDGDASEDERAFLRRTARVWREQAILHQPAGSETATVTAGRRAPRGDSLVTLAERHERGWLAWYWEEGLHLLFWRKRGAGVAGAEIGRVPLLARLVGELPQIDLADGRIVLADSRGASLYQWGPFEPSAGAEPSALRWLAYPLDGFTLAYYPGYGGAVLAGSVDLVVGASVGAVALLLLGLAIVLHRERTREAREAEQRVGFVTQVSHELKTPLTNIRLYAELLEGQLDPDDGRAHKHLAVIVAEGQRLSRLIGNILTFSRHQKDGSPLQLQTIALAPVVDQVLAPFLPALEAKGFQIERRGAAARPVRADPDALEQILGNLISNVEKYAAQGRYLGIELAQDEVQTSVRVQDHGPGVPPRDRQRVFEPFVRLGDRLLDATGTGIGLTIARELARRHGGSLELLPAERGAIFELRLPNPKETPR